MVLITCNKITPTVTFRYILSSDINVRSNTAVKITFRMSKVSIKCTYPNHSLVFLVGSWNIMKLFIENRFGTLWLSLNILRWVGFLVPEELKGCARRLYPWYVFAWFMFIVGIYIITEIGEIIQVWGNMAAMTNVSFLFFTNMAFATKILVVLLRRSQILAIISTGDEDLRAETRKDGIEIVKSADKETMFLHGIYLLFTLITISGWAASAEKNQLPLPAWYPYDTNKSPTYEITYAHQIVAVLLIALVNMSMDQLVISLTAVCRCRLKLVSVSLAAICEDMVTMDKLLTKEQQATASDRLRHCVTCHQSALNSAAQIQHCFSEPMLAQFTVSIVIICVTAYQMALETNWLRAMSMGAYLNCMVIQVFLYCYEGNYLTKESEDIADAAYSCSWYSCSSSFKRTLMVMMTRSRRVVELTAGGFTTLSLSCFVSIIKASYSYYTVLRQMEE